MTPITNYNVVGAETELSYKERCTKCDYTMAKYLNIMEQEL